MRKLSKAAVAAAVIASVSFIATGTATAQAAVPMYGGGGCKSHDLDLDLLGEVGIANGLLGNLVNGEGSPGAQITHVGSDCGHDR
ncbi:hypothetical protein GCM10010260_80200 [Streptomyces filipinensis]|uniref:DUF320 domain-containing protein n=1 Tax=Streptomyces filipinensis TaxID=66887 RepID=A0A918MEZ4_9ACTN|nr:hypothetical protein [Streptomyces filipinensis]GGV27673.1 hypothetical protein GCM10010260_80200 [Streptomyces filipinensis]